MIRLDTGTGLASPVPVSFVASEATSSSASGLPAVASYIRSATSPATGAPASRARSSSATGRSRPPISSVGRSAPSSSEACPSRTASTTATGSASSRRMANRSASALGGVKPVGVVDERQHRTLLGVGGEQAQRRGADREAVRLHRLAAARARPGGQRPAGPARVRAPARAGRRSSSSPANGTAASDSIPRARRICIPSASSAASSSSAVLPIPASPTSASTPL